MKAGIDHTGSLFLRAVINRMKMMGLNQSELARRMNASRPYVVKVLRGDVNITLGSAARFAKALQMDFFPILADAGSTLKVEKRVSEFETVTRSITPGEIS